MSPQTNGLLSNLPETEYEAFSGELKLTFLHKGQVLFDAGEVPRHVYFPVGAVVSMMNDSEDGESLETFMLGKTCMVGVATVGQPSFYRALVRNTGPAYQLPTRVLHLLRAQCPSYFQNATQAVNHMVMLLSQSLVCSKRHTFEQQLIRWMLITLDRTLENRIEITHHELSEILGFRREGVTLNLRKMVDRAEITVRRGEITVLDCAALQARVCECYRVTPPKLPAKAPAMALAA